MGAKGRVAAGILSLTLALSAGTALAQNGQGQNNNNQGQNQNGTHGVPELSAGAIPSMVAVLLVGTALVTTRRVASKKP